MPRKKSKKAPLIADPEAMSKIAVAAEAAGLTVEELCTLVVDSGALALASSDSESEGAYTFDDLGRRMWAMMNSVRVSRRPEWFQALAESQQNALIVHWRNHGFSSELIAHHLELDETKVRNVYHEHADNIGSQVIGVRLSTIAGNMQLLSEEVIQRAADNGDYKTMWRVEKERVKLLQDLGIVDKAIHKVEVSHKIDGRTEEEIRKLVDLEQKRRARIGELKDAEFEVLDPVPDMPGLEAEK